MKTLAQWHENNTNFSDFIKPGDEVDEALYMYFLEVLPPREYSVQGSITTFQVGERVDERGFDTFQNENNKKYTYLGVFPRLER